MKIRDFCKTSIDSHEWICEGVGQPIMCSICGKKITAQKYYNKYGDIIGWAKDGDLVIKKQ